MPYKKGSGLTLTEVLIVITILGILSGLALSQFNKSKERSLTREAKANLKRIAEAQKNYNLENDQYYPGSGSVTDINTINSNLSVMLIETNWDYFISSTTTADYTAYANRAGSGSYLDCEYSLSYNADEPTPNSSCP